MKKDKTEALKLALKLLSIRDRTEAEIREKLKNKGILPHIIDEVLDYLKEKGFIDDRRFIEKAEKIAEDRFLGKMGVGHYLLRKGIDKQLITSIPELDEFSIAIKLLERKKYLLKDCPEEKKKTKIAGFLLRRGFSWDTVNKCLKNFLGG